MEEGRWGCGWRTLALSYCPYWDKATKHRNKSATYHCAFSSFPLKSERRKCFNAFPDEYWKGDYEG